MLRNMTASPEVDAIGMQRNVRIETMGASNQGKNQLPLSTVQYLTFLTAGEEYAISIVKVSEIVEYEAVTTVPNTPIWIRGVTNLRGRVVPVVDLAVKFGLPPATFPSFPASSSPK